MATALTIGQLAKLMHISPHHIRYFEKKGIFEPAYINSKGYRMYSMDEVYSLSHILLLREMDISLSDIKTLLENGGENDYIRVLNDSVKDISQRITDLEKLRKRVQDLIHLAGQLHNHVDHFGITTYDTRHLTLLKTFPMSSMPSIIEYYEFMEEYHYLHDEDIYELCDDCNYYICHKDKDGQITLPAGSYLTYEGFSSSGNDLDQKIEALKDYARTKDLNLTGQLIITENTNLSLFDQQTIHVTLEMQIDD